MSSKGVGIHILPFIRTKPFSVHSLSYTPSYNFLAFGYDPLTPSVHSITGSFGLDNQKMIALCQGLEACSALQELTLGISRLIEKRRTGSASLNVSTLILITGRSEEIGLEGWTALGRVLSSNRNLKKFGLGEQRE